LNAALFVMVNRFAMATGWLHGVGVAYAADGLVVFAVLLLAGWWSARTRAGMAAMAAALWAPLGMLLTTARRHSADPGQSGARGDQPAQQPVPDSARSTPAT
jgi:hypothetical protein